MPLMTPPPGERFVRFVGDYIEFTISAAESQELSQQGWKALLRTNIGRARKVGEEIIQAHTKNVPLAGASWRDIPMKQTPNGWILELPLTESGYFKAKAYLADAKGWQHWPNGADVGVSVHPNAYRTANTIYCAFTRTFGNRPAAIADANQRADLLLELDKEGYTVIPASGTLRDLKKALPEIVRTLGCRIVQLLPINPTPTTYARYGSFGSPYAALDLTLIDPALVEFDKKTTGVDQFRELTFAAHSLNAKILLDIVINHTGWASALHEQHPDWFVRQPDGTFVSPGAWGVTWEDLVELKHDNVRLWDELAGMLLTWCRRGVDGFRCDAGYKVPRKAWQYIIARVQHEFPDTIFLLEGLGGAWETTEALLTEGRMQWAYSELFQNYSGSEVARYLDHSTNQSKRAGLLVHFSETHDNDRLATKGRAWSLLRNRLCGLTSASGGFAFTCGVEWLATEKINVHRRTDIRSGEKDNIVPELAALNRLLSEEPCFFDGAEMTRVSDSDSPCFAMLRQSMGGERACLILVNLDAAKQRDVRLNLPVDPVRFPGPQKAALSDWKDLLGQEAPAMSVDSEGFVVAKLQPAAVFCLSPGKAAAAGDTYRTKRGRAAWAMQALAGISSAQDFPVLPWERLAEIVAKSPARFLAAACAVCRGDHEWTAENLFSAAAADLWTPVIRWSVADRNRVTPVPPDHWLLIEDDAPFRATLSPENQTAMHIESVEAAAGFVGCFRLQEPCSAALTVERYGSGEREVSAAVRFLGPAPANSQPFPASADLVLLTNGRGGMSRLCVDLGHITSKYDCVLGANLHPSVPVDRHIFAKRIRLWMIADGFNSPLNYQSLKTFRAGPPAQWDFVANAGDGRTVEVSVTAEMVPGRNTVVFTCSRPTTAAATGKQLPSATDVRIIARLDIEDRNFHTQTHFNGGADHHFNSNVRGLGRDQKPASGGDLTGFEFTPAADRQLRVYSTSGSYHPQSEWSQAIGHPVEQTRGHVGHGDAFSPGWFEVPLGKGDSFQIVVTAEAGNTSQPVLLSNKQGTNRHDFESALRQAVGAFVVRRDHGKTVIAGYPWFLDWGRDTFICARGLLAAGLQDEVKQIALTFARFETDGTLPNIIHGEDASNRDTSDAPLWFGVVCEELAAAIGPGFYDATVDQKSRRAIRDVLKSIAANYAKGTQNGIRMDPDSALIWSPAHFTWMDTNYPAGTPREGYPVEIQALWIRLLRQLAKIDSEQSDKWRRLEQQARESVHELFWSGEFGWFGDVLLCASSVPARKATLDTALRSNCLFLASLGIAAGDQAKKTVAAAQRWLVVPGALRTLAPLTVEVPLSIYANDGRLLNDPSRPYWPRYEGDEDTQRKPAYHNGTAWTWTFPVFCEALAQAWDFSPPAVAAARAYLGSMDELLTKGCIGQLPEIVDGDAPHQQRGCDAQAWGVTEALRVLSLLNGHKQTRLLEFGRID